MCTGQGKISSKRPHGFKGTKHKKNQTRKDLIITKQKSCCRYCKLPFKKTELNLIKKNHTLQEGEIYESKNNFVVSCKKCSSKKSKMDHIPFLKLLEEEKKGIREEIKDNYTTIAPRVFNRYQHRCIYCDFEYGFTPNGVKLTIEHKIPVSSLGTNSDKNLASGCEMHNKEKGNKTTKQYFKYLEKMGRKKKKIKMA